MNYLNFDLEIGPGNQREYPVAVLSSPDGEVRSSMNLPFDEQILKNYLNDLQAIILYPEDVRRQFLSREVKNMQQFGQHLFDALIFGEVRSRYDVSLHKADQLDMGLRLRLRIRANELIALPWELLYDSRQNEYVCLSRYTPIVRYVELARGVQALKVKLPLRVLVMIGKSDDQIELNIEHEKEVLHEGLKDLETKGLVELTWKSVRNWQDFQQAMWPSSGSWHIFHFIGHGRFDPDINEGLILLAGEHDHAYSLKASQLSKILADNKSLRLVLLNVCEGAKGNPHDIFSSTATTLVRRGIPAVLAMQYKITDNAAIQFTHTFYKALAEGMPIDTAVVEARKAISLATADNFEWATPVLYMRSPDGVLFNIVYKTTSRRKKLEYSNITASSSNSSSFPSTNSGVTYPQSSADLVLIGTNLFTYQDHTKAIETLVWSPNGSQIASASYDKTVHIWDIANRNNIFTFHDYFAVRAVAWSPNGSQIASAGDDKVVRIWDISTRRNLFTYLGHSSVIETVAWSPNGSQIASAGDDQTVCIWDVTTGNTILIYRSYSGTVRTVAWSPNGSQIASAGDDQTVRIWDVTTGNTILIYRSHSGTVRTVAWSPNGSQIASAGDDQTVCIWDVTTGNTILIYRSHSGTVRTVAWSPNGSQIASAGDDQTVCIWDVTTGNTILIYRSHSGTVRTVAWSPNGSQIASAGDDHAINVWQSR